MRFGYALVLCAALLLVGCSDNTPAPNTSQAEVPSASSDALVEDTPEYLSVLQKVFETTPECRDYFLNGDFTYYRKLDDTYSLIKYDNWSAKGGLLLVNTLDWNVQPITGYKHYEIPDHSSMDDIWYDDTAQTISFWNWNGRQILQAGDFPYADVYSIPSNSISRKHRSLNHYTKYFHIAGRTDDVAQMSILKNSEHSVQFYYTLAENLLANFDADMYTPDIEYFYSQRDCSVQLSIYGVSYDSVTTSKALEQINGINGVTIATDKTSTGSVMQIAFTVDTGYDLFMKNEWHDDYMVTLGIWTEPARAPKPPM